MPEELAIERFGEKNIEVFHSYFKPLEWTVPHRGDNACYVKLVCNLQDNLRVLGLHICGPNAGEITQGFALGMKLGATKADFDNTVGIHPTTARQSGCAFGGRRCGLPHARRRRWCRRPPRRPRQGGAG